AVPTPTSDEAFWIREVKRRYKHEITPAELGWYRHTLDAEMHGDETLMAQEYACLPEEAFQSFGQKVFTPDTIRRLRSEETPRPTFYRYDWGKTLDPGDGGTQVKECHPEDAGLVVWEEPVKDGVYVVSGHPGWSSDPNAEEFVAHVYRAWPDHLVQVAEYSGD